MANERLRAAMAAAALTSDEVASRVGVDPKTVERWLATGRTPHRTHRYASARVLGVDPAYLWPEPDAALSVRPVRTELVELYPNRGAVPRSLWQSLLETSSLSVDLLAYAGLFLPDGHPEVVQVLCGKAAAGAKVRVALGDPASDAVRLRGEEEDIGEDLAARVRLSLTYLRGLIDAPGVELRLHATTLYNSLYRFDDDMLVNMHVFGAPAAQSPVMHLRRQPNGRLFDHYMAGFDRVWATTSDVPDRSQVASVAAAPAAVGAA